VTSKIDNRERFVLARREIIAAKRRHLVVRTLVHLFSVNRAAMIWAIAECTLELPDFSKNPRGGLAQLSVAVNFAL